MRITNRYLVNTYLSDLNNNLQNMQKYQEQLSSGKEIRRPSDDPQRVARAMSLNSSINRNDQYQRNIEDASGWIDTTDTALGQINDSLQRIRELMLAASNGTNTQTELDAYKAEIKQKIDEIAQCGNTNYDGRYIFAGTLTTDPPFKSDGNGNLVCTLGMKQINKYDSKLYREISPDVTADININIKQILQGQDINGAPLNLNDTLKNVTEALNEGNNSELSGDLLKQMQDNIDNVLRLRAEAGAKANRMDSAKAKNDEETFNMTEVLSKTADIDLAEKTMEYSVMQTVYQSSLMTGARILQPSLIDFLK